MLNYKMNIKNIQNNSTFRMPTFFLFLFLISIFFLGIGYSQVSGVNLDIEGTASAPIPKTVLITDVTYYSSNNADYSLSTINDYNLTLLNSNIVLSSSNLNSTITYKIKVKNNSETPATYNQALFSTELGYSNTDIEFVVSGIAQGDVLDSQEEREFTVTFKYIDSLTSITNNSLVSLINFNFDLVNVIAKIGENYYNTLQDAINAVSTNGAETTIELLADTSEIITISSGKNIKLNLKNNVLSNSGNNPVISNNGTLNIYNGKVFSDASGNGAINNEQTGTIIIDGIRVECIGGKQAFYNNKGTATIKGDANLSATSNQRAAVQNVSGGIMTILGGTITSTGSDGLKNEGDLTIGIKDGIASRSVPEIIGKNNGINSSHNYNFYDGIAKGKNKGINKDSYVVDKEIGYDIVTSSENIAGTTYTTAYLVSDFKVVTFNYNNGTETEPIRKVESGNAIGPLPTSTRDGYELLGWFTELEGGTEITATQIINDDVTYYAHWYKKPLIARIGSNNYYSLEDAINAVPSNTQTTVVLLEDTSEIITVTADKNIILDLNSNTLSVDGNTSALITNLGTLTITNGTVTSDADYATINQNGGSLTVSANIISTGTRSAIYAIGGTTRIVDGAYLSSTTTGTPSGSSNLGRGTLHCINNCTAIITGGTIIGVHQQAVSSQGDVTIGTKDGNVNNSKPIIRGETYGIVNKKYVRFYDGTVYGINGGISGNITDLETSIGTGQEIIDGKIYIKQFNQ